MFAFHGMDNISDCKVTTLFLIDNTFPKIFYLLFFFILFNVVKEFYVPLHFAVYKSLFRFNTLIIYMQTDRLEELIPLLKDKNKRNVAFNTLVKLTKQRLYWHIRKMVLVHEDADDVLQNTYVKVWKSIDNFRGDSALYTWLFRIATNETLTFLAQQRIKNVATSIEYEDLLISKMEADAYYDGDEMAKKFERAILSLPEKQRLVFNMKYYEDMKYEEISKITGTSEGALKASYHIAVKKIEQFIKEED